jgi:hypothetical protein
MGGVSFLCIVVVVCFFQGTGCSVRDSVVVLCTVSDDLEV